MSSVRTFLALCAGAAVLAAGCGAKSGTVAAPGDAASKADVKALEKRVAELEAKLGKAPAPTPGPVTTAPVAGSADLAAKLAALEVKVAALAASGGGGGAAAAVAGPAQAIGIANDKGKDLWGCPKVDKGLVVNGKADSPQWKKAKQVQLVSDEGKRLACDTTVAICHDTENFYIAAVCMESAMDKLKITCKNRDDKVYSDDCIEFYIDPELDRNDAVKFVVNPDGVFMDFLRDTHGDAGDVTWNATVKTSKLADRFIMEIAIPLKDMGIKYKAGLEIGFNAYRMRTINGESSTWWGECNKIDSIGKVVFE
jgi:hypothetical protein